MAVLSSSRSSRQAGSAYVITLLVLVVLTIFGLTLALMTQGEVQIAGAERLASRTLYATESGLRATLLEAYTDASTNCRIWAFVDDSTDANEVEAEQIGTQVRTGGAFPIFSGPCNLCQINQDRTLVRVTYTSSAQGRRVVGAADNALVTDPNRILGQASIGLMLHQDSTQQEQLTLMSAVSGGGCKGFFEDDLNANTRDPAAGG